MHKEKEKRKQSSFSKASEDRQTTNHSQPQAINVNPLNGHRAERAVRVLIEQIANIRYVKQWAEKTGTSESTLHRLILEIYGKTPGTILKEIKYEKVLYELNQNTEACAYSLAIDSGFESEDALRMFLRRGFGTNISTLRQHFFIGELQHEWSWLIGK